MNRLTVHAVTPYCMPRLCIPIITFWVCHTLLFVLPVRVEGKNGTYVELYQNALQP